ncbi:MAG: cation:proton antiporter [Candidatus Njordarchaeia archaeon]
MPEIIYALTIIIIVGILLANLAKFYKTSSVVPLLLGGLLLRYFGLLEPDLIPDFEPVLILTLSLVLFYAGLTLDVKNVIRYWKVIALVAIVGVFLFTVILGPIVYYFSLGFTISSAFLLAAVLAPTDPAALFSVLESSAKVKRKLRTILIGESCFNDAAAFVTVFIVLVPLFMANVPPSPIVIVLSFIWSIAGGALSGIVVTYLLGRLIEQLKDPTATRVLVIVSAIVAYLLAEMVHASGVIASLVSGILYGNMRIIGISPIPKRSIIKLMEEINFIVEIFIFILLGSLINPVELPIIVIPGTIIAVFSLLIARPAVIFVLTIIEKRINWKERVFLSLAGTKGVTSGALALALAAINAPSSHQILVLTFLTILATVSFQTVALPYIVRRFKLEEKEDVLQELILKRNALREALLDLVDKYSNGEISLEVYRELSSEIKDSISEIEREIGEITEMRRITMEKLRTKIDMLKKQISYFDKEYNEGRISADLYERIVSELRDEIDDLKSALKELK